MEVLLWTLLAFTLGSLPFSVWVGKLALKADIREVGDKNPGATNVLRSGNFLWFTLALLLDISKGALPLGFAYQIFGIQDWRIVPIVIAPTLGHAFSPFLNFRGGKAIAATFGAWIGVTLWVVPLISLPTLIILALLVTPHGWAVLGTLIVILGSFVTIWPNPVWFWGFFTTSLLLLYTHRADFQRRPRWRPGEKRAKAA